MLFVTKINLSSFTISTNVWPLVVSLFFEFELPFGLHQKLIKFYRNV